MAEMTETFGRTYGLKTRKGIALLQIVEPVTDPTRPQLTRVMGGFLPENYTRDDVNAHLLQKELFFLETPLRMVGPRSKIYREFFEFIMNCAVPPEVKLPTYVRGYSVDNAGNVRWYRKLRNANTREYVRKLTPSFLELSPDSIWSFPDIVSFLEDGKTIRDYI